ncbi:hypothetical protein GCM10007989_36400 [Devosia pacifica]|uniref:Uncharacterized protein n=1 Tax=Devosia pacifica TaxID=1335967 RepID=A0A918VYY9_9HYPH|nr:hypothetical protein [Devosia pacifica]GHA36975.1 hypothetical protein GCM10007989_36400 [Devosia pacifica]
MSNMKRIGGPLATVTAAALLSVALPSSAALAQKTKTPEASELAFQVNVPDVTVEQSTIDADTLRAILTGDFESHAEDLAALDAASITIPTVEVTASGEEMDDFLITYNDVTIEDVIDGVAGSVTIGSITMEDGEEFSGSFDTMSASALNINALLGFYGFVEQSSSEFQTIYTDVTMAGGSITTPEVTCEIGSMQVAEFSARPLEVPFTEFMSIANQLEASSEDDDEGEPDPELMADFLPMYIDLITSFRSAPFTFDGIDCSGEDDTGEPVSVVVGPVTMGGFEPGTYPEIAVEDVSIELTEDGSVGSMAFDSFVFKGFDFSDQIDVIAGMPVSDADEWFRDNARQLIPAFAGFSISGLEMDFPDTDNEGERIVASVGSVDLTLGDYTNGIPASIDASAENILVDLPADSEDEQLQQLRAMGIESVDVGFELSMNWLAELDQIEINTLMLEEADLGSINIAGTVGNATEQLFSENNDLAMVAAMGTTAKDLQITVVDNGLTELLLSDAAAQQGVDVSTMRPIIAGVAEGMAIGLLGGSSDAEAVGDALSSFIRDGGTLMLDITSLDEVGLGLADFMAAQEDPTVLLEKVSIQAEAE